jgi:hypothetical protein
MTPKQAQEEQDRLALLGRASQRVVLSQLEAEQAFEAARQGRRCIERSRKLMEWRTYPYDERDRLPRRL